MFILIAWSHRYEHKLTYERARCAQYTLPIMHAQRQPNQEYVSVDQQKLNNMWWQTWLAVKNLAHFTFLCFSVSLCVYGCQKLCPFFLFPLMMFGCWHFLIFLFVRLSRSLALSCSLPEASLTGFRAVSFGVRQLLVLFGRLYCQFSFKYHLNCECACVSYACVFIVSGLSSNFRTFVFHLMSVVLV